MPWCPFGGVPSDPCDQGTFETTTAPKAPGSSNAGSKTANHPEWSLKASRGNGHDSGKRTFSGGGSPLGEGREAAQSCLEPSTAAQCPGVPL
eukprot:5704565-Alexandrium_andersonii.AAC.1